MNVTHESKSPADGPRTIPQLVPWIEEQLTAVKHLVLACAKVDSPLNCGPPAGRGQERSELQQQIIRSLQEAVTLLGLLLNQPQKEEVSLGALSRALLAAGNGERFEPAIRAAIRDYENALAEVRRIAAYDRLPETVRQDLIAGYQRILAEHKQRLRLLGVGLHSASVGETVDAARHHVVAKRPTTDPDCVGKIAECLAPEFTWRSPTGVERREPAKVAAYVLERANYHDTPRPGLH